MEKNKLKILGFGSLLAVAVGLVVSQGVMALMLTGAGIGGIGFLIPLTLGLILAITYVISFSELSLMIPKSGSLASYTEVAIGNLPAIIAVFAGYVVVAMFALSAELLLVDHIIGKVFPGAFPEFLIGFLILGLFTVLNLMGIDVFANIQKGLATIMIILLVILGIGSLFAIGNPHTEGINLTDNMNPLGAGVITLVALAVWGYVGAEFACPLVEECRDPVKDLPKAMLTGVVMIFIVIAMYSMGALMYIPADELAASELPHYDFALAAFGETGLIFVVIAAVAATCSTVNSSLAAVPHMLYGMAKNGQVFSQFKLTTKDKQVPWVAVLFISVISALPMVFMYDKQGAVLMMLVAAAISWLIAYIITHINVIVLRKRYPNLDRPYKTPFYPVPQVIGILGMLYAILYASETADIYYAAIIVLLIAVVFGVFWVKFKMKTGLFEPVPIEKVLDIKPRRWKG